MSRQSHQSIVDSIKERQRDDPQFKKAWNTYCDDYSDGTRDPSRHELGFLKAAMRELGIQSGGGGRKGGRGGSRWEESDEGGRGRRKGGGRKGGSNSNGDLVATIRKYQKEGDWQKEWCTYCDEHGEGTYDPSLHAASFLQAAIDDLGAPSSAVDSIQTDDQRRYASMVKDNQRDSAWHTRWADYCHEHGEGTRDPSRHTAAFLRGALAALQGDNTTDTKHYELVQRVKEYQKSNPAWNAHWSRHCEKYSDGTRDPSYHEMSFLENALNTLDTCLDKESEHTEVVNTIKTMQRENTTWRTRWADYCAEYGDGTRDPAFHDLAFLKRALRDLGPEDEEHRMGLRSSDKSHTTLVEEVKEMQRSDIRMQQRWVEYCENWSDGTLNPAQHDAGFLRKALGEISKSRRPDSQRQQEIQLLCEARRTAQRSRAFERADQLRTMLWSMGVEINDKKKIWRSDDGLTGSFSEESHTTAEAHPHTHTHTHASHGYQDWEPRPRRGGYRGGKGGK